MSWLVTGAKQFHQVLRGHTDQLPQPHIACRINGNAAQEAELSKETLCRLQGFGGSIAGQTTPAAGDLKASAAYPIASPTDDEFFLAAHHDERVEHLSAVIETRTQICFLESPAQSVPPVHAALRLTNVEPVARWTSIFRVCNDLPAVIQDSHCGDDESTQFIRGHLS